MQHLIEGIDPTVLPEISPSDLLQLVRVAKPYTGQGWIIWADSAPDVVADPELEQFLWGKTVAGVPNEEFYYYDGAAWTLMPYADGTLLANGSVAITAISISGGAALKILRINAANTALEWVTVVDAIAAGSLAVAKLVAGVGSPPFVLTSQGGTVAWTTITSMLSVMTNNTLPIDKLVRGSANTFLRVTPAGTGLEWTTVDISAVLAVGWTAGQGIRRNAGNTGWEAFTPVTAVGLTKSFTSNLVAVPVSPAFSTGPFTHALGAVPTVVSGFLVCISADLNYAIGDSINLSDVVVRDSSDDFKFTIFADSTTVTALLPISPGTYDIYVVNKTTGAAAVIDDTKWNIRIHAYA